MWLKIKWIKWKIKKSGMKLSPEGYRMKRYFEGLRDGTVDYAIGKFDDVLENFMEERGLTKEEAIEAMLYGMELMGC